MLVITLAERLLGAGPAGAMDSICFFLLGLSIWQGSGTQGPSPKDRFSVGVKEKLAILESSESGRDSKTGCPGPCPAVAPWKPTRPLGSD